MANGGGCSGGDEWSKPKKPDPTPDPGPLERPKPVKP